VAVGSRVAIGYTPDEFTSSVYVVSPTGLASSRADLEVATEFDVLEPGTISFLALDVDGRLLDLMHVDAFEPIVSIGWQVGGSTLVVGESKTLEVFPSSRTGEILGGVLDYAWTSSNEPILSLDTSPGGRRGYGIGLCAVLACSFDHVYVVAVAGATSHHDFEIDHEEVTVPVGVAVAVRFEARTRRGKVLDPSLVPSAVDEGIVDLYGAPESDAWVLVGVTEGQTCLEFADAPEASCLPVFVPLQTPPPE
jgi:hypothetical protein